MDMTRSAFERSSRDSQQIGNEEIPTLNTPVGVFVSFQARLINRYVNLPVPTVMIHVYFAPRLVTIRLRQPQVNQQTEAGWASTLTLWHQIIRDTELFHMRGGASAAFIRASSSPCDTYFLNSINNQPKFNIYAHQSWLSAAGNSIVPCKEV
jgi:hypothetical protein